MVDNYCSFEIPSTKTAVFVCENLQYLKFISSGDHDKETVTMRHLRNKLKDRYNNIIVVKKKTLLQAAESNEKMEVFLKKELSNYLFLLFRTGKFERD